MSDILDRLRNFDVDHSWRLRSEAADEIEERRRSNLALEEERLRLCAIITELEERVHDANGVASLAMKHRDTAEALNTELEAWFRSWRLGRTG